MGPGTAEVAQLQAGTQMPVTVTAPLCIPGSTIVVHVDADGRVEQSDERDDRVRRRWPLALG